MTNTKNTKRALLSSVLALFLCFAMLLGTTYAWFTDSVTSANNIIKSGNLDIELEYAKVVDGAITEWDTVAGKDNIFDKNALWEPGRVEVVYLKVSNLGTLALKYQLGVNIVNEIGGKNVAGEDFKLSDHLVFKVVDLATEPETAYTREEAVAEAGNVKGLKDYNSDTTALEVGGTDYVALIVYMPENVGNEANYRGDAIPTITLGINLYATQQMSEKDSFGDNYDEYAGLPWDGESKEDPKADENGVIHVTNAAELVAMMDTTGNSIYSGKTIVLDADINLGGKTVKGIGGDDNFAGVFDGQGHTISNFTVDASNRSFYAGLFNQVSHGGTVKNLTVKGATIIGNSMVGAVASSVDSSATVDNCRAIGCTLIGVKKVGAVVGYSAGSTVTNNYAENCAVYYSEKEGAEILGYENTGSTVNNNTFTDVEVVNATVILDADDLVYFAKSVNVDGETYAGKTVKLAADIDLAGKLWIPVGQTQVSSFQGTFDGQGHTIKNMTVNYTDTNSNYACGLFGWIELHNDAPIVIQNVKFDNANVTGIKYTGVVAGYANGASGAEIKNCVVTNSTVTSNSKNAGGIIGYMGKGVLTGNTVSGCTISAKYDVGGIANSVEPAVTFQNNKVENTKIYYEEDQSYDAAGIFTGGKVVYRDDNNKTTFVPDSTNTNSNVTVNKLVAVSTASELSAALNKTYTEDTTVMLTNDITLTGEWGEHSLDGRNNANLTINGNGNTIYGLTSTNYYSGNGFNSNGLVTYIKSGLSSVTFKNLTINGATLTNEGGDSAATGVFVGDTNTVNVTFDTCTVTGANINSYKYAGGFIGYTQDVNTTKKTVTFKNCVVSDSNINTTDSSVGGLVGHNYTDLTITGCQIKGNTTIKCAEDRTGEDAKAGYLIGTVNGGSASISNITVDSTVNLDTMGGTTYDTTKYVGRNYGTVTGVTANP